MKAPRMRPLPLAEVLRLTGARAEGSPPGMFQAVRTLEDAGPQDLSFFSGGRYREAFEATKAGAVLAPEGSVSPKSTPLLIVKNPSLALAKVLEAACAAEPAWTGVAAGARVSPQASVAKDVSIHDGASVAAGTVIEKHVTLHAGVAVGENCRVGEGSEIFPNAVLYPNTVIGKRVRVHAGSVIGSDGFGYVHDGTRHLKVPQVGRVRIEDDVEIGACVTIDRATLGETVIGEGSKIDNLVQIGHNVVLGRQCVVVAQVGIAGSTHIGDGVVVGGQTGIGGHLRIGSGVRIGAKSGITNDVPAGETMTGHPAMTHRQWLKLQVLLRRLLRGEKA